MSLKDEGALWEMIGPEVDIEFSIQACPIGCFLQILDMDKEENTFMGRVDLTIPIKVIEGMLRKYLFLPRLADYIR